MSIMFLCNKIIKVYKKKEKIKHLYKLVVTETNDALYYTLLLSSCLVLLHADSKLCPGTKVKISIIKYPGEMSCTKCV